MKLLIIEDEAELRNIILKYLQKEGYVCESACDFNEGFKKVNNYEYDCVLVDLNLPKGDGLNLVKMLREDESKAGIIIISAKNSIDDRIKGLEEGADDYLVKPFNLSELNARVKAVIRRKTNHVSKEMVFGDMCINFDERVVRIGDLALSLTKKEYEILIYLARNKNRVVTKDSIAEHLWGDYMDEAVSFDFIYAHVKNLRKKLAEQECGHYLKTIYGIGYKFEVN